MIGRMGGAVGAVPVEPERGVAVVGIGGARHLECLARQGRDDERGLVLGDGDGPARGGEGPHGGGGRSGSRRRGPCSDRGRDGNVEGHRARRRLVGGGAVGIDGTGGQSVEAAVAEPGRGRDEPGGERDVGLVARDVELLAGREALRRDRGGGDDVVEHEVAHRGVRAVQLVGPGQRRGRRRRDSPGRRWRSRARWAGPAGVWLVKPDGQGVVRVRRAAQRDEADAVAVDVGGVRRPRLRSR